MTSDAFNSGFFRGIIMQKAVDFGNETKNVLKCDFLFLTPHGKLFFYRLLNE